MIYFRKTLRSFLIPFSNIVRDFIPNKKLRKRFSDFIRFDSFINLEKYFTDKYVDSTKVFDEISSCEVGDGYIFQCWWQGLENAPAIVKKCIQSVEKFKGNRKHIIITKENFKNFIDLPDFVLEKFEKGIIDITHLSDIIRLCLLSKYGGFWIDATCFITSPLPNWIEESKFFMFQSWTRIQNCFIYSVKNHPLCEEWKNLLFKYWKNENCIYHYFFAHILFSAMIDENKSLCELYKKMPCIDQASTHVLLYKLFDSFNEMEFKEIIGNSFMHKLTYKLKKNNLKKISGSYLEFILNNDLDYILKSSPR